MRNNHGAPPDAAPCAPSLPREGRSSGGQYIQRTIVGVGTKRRDVAGCAASDGIPSTSLLPLPTRQAAGLALCLAALDPFGNRTVVSGASVGASVRVGAGRGRAGGRALSRRLLVAVPAPVAGALELRQLVGQELRELRTGGRQKNTRFLDGAILQRLSE